MELNMLELSLLQRIHSVLQCEALDKIFIWISYPGNGGWGFVLFAVILLCFKKTRVIGAVMSTALIMDVLLVNVCMKPLIARVRPYDMGIPLDLITDHPGDHSFPSGHTAASFAAAVASSVGPKKVYIAMMTYAGLVGMSRLYLMMHYPTDVLAGAVCGAVCGYFAVELWKRLSESKGA